MYQFWAHKSGDTFAVAINEEGKPVLMSEALHHTEVRNDSGELADPSEFNLDNEFEGDESDYRLVEA